MSDDDVQPKSWAILQLACSMCKQLLWLRDSDSPARLIAGLQELLEEALNTIVLIPGAVPALGKKLSAIYRKALEKERVLVGVGAEPTSGRLGHRTTKEGLPAVLDAARRHEPYFAARAERVCGNPAVQWPELFGLARGFIADLDWEEFVLQNPRGQAACLVLECVELLKASNEGSPEKIEAELGDVFYNLIAFSLSVRLDAEYMTLAMPSA